MIDRVSKVTAYLHNELIKDEQEVGLITHEHAHDVFVVGRVELFLRRLGQGAD